MMKRTFVLLGVLFAAFVLLQACDERKISVKRLPESARTFIGKYFAGNTVVSAEKEKDDGKVTYNVLLSEGTEIEFDKAGFWTDVDCGFSVLPDGILPDGIAEYVDSSYPQETAYKVERKAGGYEVTLTGGSELMFNAAGEFIRSSR